MLCLYCKQISPRELRLLYHHAHFSELQASARSCPICRIMLDMFEQAVLEEIAKVAANPSDYAKVMLRRNPQSGLTQGEDGLAEQPGLAVEVVSRERYFVSRKFVLNFPGHQFSDRPIWRSTQPITFNESFPVLKGWYDECASNHGLCSSEAQLLPTRLLWIGADPKAELRLVCTSDGQKGHYAALSHCWGQAQDIVRTTTAVLDDYMREIRLECLPKTFRDAILITQRLNLQYLWVDSLCIVQDDEHDWQRESGRMAAVFLHAHLTIAATASEDSHGGCLFDRTPSTHIEVFDQGNSSDTGIPELEQLSLDTENMTETANSAPVTYVRYPADETFSLRQSPLYRRGWVLQEMVLSRRTVHFARDQLFWHCRSRITSEDGYFDAALGSTFFSLDTPAKAHMSWWTWVEDYSTRHLTKSTDRFAALAGLTLAFPSHDCSGDEYGSGSRRPVAGLWTDDIHFGLLWCAKSKGIGGGSSGGDAVGGSEETEDEPFVTASQLPMVTSGGIPSWSWASVAGPVRALSARHSPVWRDHTLHTTTHLELLNAQVTWTGVPLTSQITRGELQFARAKLAMAVVAGEPQEVQERLTRGIDPLYKDLNYRRFANLFRLVAHTTDFDAEQRPSRDCEGHACFDREPPRVGALVLCLLVSTTRHCGTCKRREKGQEGLEEGGAWVDDAECQHRMHNVLVVQSTGDAPYEFRRIGVGTILPGLGDSDYFSDCDEMEIILV